MLEKIVKIIGYVILGLSVAICLMFFFSDAPMLEKELSNIADYSPDMKILSVSNLAQSWGGLVLDYSIVLFILSAIFAVGFSIYKFVSDAIDNPKSAIKPSIALVLIIIVCILAFSLADASMPSTLATQHLDYPDSTIKLVDASLYGIYIFFALSIIALVYSELSKMWR